MKRFLATLFLSSALAISAQVPVLLPSADTVRVSTTSGLVSALVAPPKGRTILLSDGTYNLGTVWPLRIRTDSVTLYGASRDASKVILRGAGFTSSNPDEELIKIEAKGIRLAYFTLRDGRGNGVKLQTGGNDDFLIHACRFIDICERSIKGPDATVSKNGIIRYSLFEQVTPITSAIPNLNINGDGNYIAGMDLMKIEGWRIHDNVFKNIRGMTGGGRAAIFLWNGCKGVTIERNVFQGNDRAIALGNTLNTNVGMDSGVVRDNFISAGSNISIEICNSKGTEFLRNTISGPPAYFRAIQFSNNGPLTFRDNVIMGKIYRHSGPVPDTTANLWLSDVTVAGVVPEPQVRTEYQTVFVPSPPETTTVVDSIPYPVPEPYPVPYEVIKIDSFYIVPKKRVTTEVFE